MRLPEGDHRDLVALVLALGLSIALILLMVGVLYDALHSTVPGLSENATQVVLGAFGGIIGILGAYLGYKAGTNASGPKAGPTEPVERRTEGESYGDTPERPGGL